VNNQTYLSLSNSDTDEFGPHVGEQGEHESVDETKELSKVTRFLVRPESPTVLPVPEPDPPLTWYTAEIDDQTKQDETGQGDNLDETKPVFDFSEPLDPHAVDNEDL
jgi:hypothetical protein